MEFVMSQPLTSSDLNRDCHCISVDRAALRQEFQRILSASALPVQPIDIPDTLFADAPVFLWDGHVQAMGDVVRAVDAVTQNAPYRATVLARLPEPARIHHGPHGVFTSFDFHIDETGPRLIEINTNAGGVLLNHYLASAQRACCPEVASAMTAHPNLAGSEAAIVAMFRAEWQRQRAAEPLRTIAIVDTNPTGQFLYPEFLLFQSLFNRHGITAMIADPGDLAIRRGALWAGATEVDLVYNRLTDFYLTKPQSATLREAYERDLAVVTPSPHSYALYADKRNLPLMADPDALRAFGVVASVIDTLTRSLPKTFPVTPADADRLWAERRSYFFKPATGYGSRGAYSGAKLTRRVWQEIVGGDYLAQGLVVPTERQLRIDGEIRSLKMDFRCVAYNGEVQQISARLYRGQTTNLRTLGGGLATVVATPDDAPLTAPA
jgi:hypothetical protein